MSDHTEIVARQEFETGDDFYEGILVNDKYSLFNMETVRNGQVADLPTKFVTRIVKKDKVILSNSKISVQEVRYISMREVEDEDHLKFNLIKPCEHGSNAPAMPSLRLDMRDRDYNEPVRDRDKDWALTSQRDMIDKKGYEQINPTLDLNLGQYEHIDTSSTLFWSPGFQALLREKVLLKKAAIISDTNCVVTIFGLGITGRIVSNGSNTGKLVIIEVYSIWNCKKYMMVLNTQKIRVIFSKMPDFLKPGRKTDLLNELVALLYFNYTIIIPNKFGGGNQNADNPFTSNKDHNSGADDDQSEHSMDTYHTVLSSHSVYNEANASVQTVEHLQLPVMPVGYPKTIEQMIRIPPVQPDSATSPPPIIKQTLALGTERRINGPKLRKQLHLQHLKDQELHEAELLRLWNATPRIRRNLVIIRGFRMNNKLIVLRGYHNTIRPTTVTIKAMVANECNELNLYLNLARVRELLSISVHPVQWSQGDIKQFLRQVVNRIVLVRVNADHTNPDLLPDIEPPIVNGLVTERMVDNHCMLAFAGDNGSEMELARFRTGRDVLSSLRLKTQHHRPVNAKIFDPYHLSDTLAPNEDILSDLSPVADSLSVDSQYVITQSPVLTGSVIAKLMDVPPGGSLASIETPTASVVTQSPPPELHRNLLCWTSLGAINSTRRLDNTLYGTMRPYRELCKGRRMTCRGMRVGGVYCIYSLYVKNPIYQTDIPQWPMRSEVVTDEQSTSQVEKPEEPLNEHVFTFVSKPDGVTDTTPDPNHIPDSEELSAGQHEEEEEGSEEGSDDEEEEGDQKHTPLKSDEVEEEEDLSMPVDPIDLKCDLFEESCPNLRVELEICIPYVSTLFNNQIIPARTTLKLSLTKADLFFFVADRDALSLALQSTYFDFYNSQDSKIVGRAEAAWDYIGRCLMTQCSWVVRSNPQQPYDSTIPPPVMRTRRDNDKQVDSLHEESSVTSENTNDHITSSEPQHNSDDNKQPENYSPPPQQHDETQHNCPPQPQPQTDEETLDALREILQIDAYRSDLILTPSTPYLTLTWSTTLVCKAMKVNCSVPSRGSTVLMQVYYWQRDDQNGVVCIDRERHSVYRTQNESLQLQRMQNNAFRFMSAYERTASVQTYLALELNYLEDDSGCGYISLVEKTDKGAVALDEEDAADYAAQAAEAIARADDKIQSKKNNVYKF